jgi:hypothetical protein
MAPPASCGALRCGQRHPALCVRAVAHRRAPHALQRPCLNVSQALPVHRNRSPLPQPSQHAFEALDDLVALYRPPRRPCPGYQIVLRFFRYIFPGWVPFARKTGPLSMVVGGT